jgi:hypothetical protein
MKDGTVALLAFVALVGLRLNRDTSPRDGLVNEGEGWHFPPLVGAVGVYIILRLFK